MLLPFLTAGFLAATTLGASSIPENPSKTLDKRSTTLCGQWDSLETGSYTLYNDLWGESAATSGSQCSTFVSLSGNTIVWSTNWTWVGASSSVKSFANIGFSSTGYQVSEISSMPSVWDYT